VPATCDTELLLPAQGCFRLFKSRSSARSTNIWLCLYLVAEPAHLSSDCNRVSSTNAESLMVCMRQRLEDVERGGQDRCNVMCLRLQSLPSRLPGLHTACYRTQEQVSLLAFPQQLTLSIKCCNLTSVRIDVRRTHRLAGRGGRTGSPERHRCSPGACQLPLAAWCAAQQRTLASLAGCWWDIRLQGRRLSWEDGVR